MTRIYYAIYIAAITVANWAVSRQWDIDKRKIGIEGDPK